jgi:sigma-B regulation protein RsbU (phosphoserine phosphatase)
MTKVSIPIADVILDSLNDGLYVCDTERRIIYWSKSAERITGWTPEDVVGLRCLDNILEHVDKDGRRLCGEEFCPLHRSMRTNSRSSSPIIVFGKTKTGGRVPMVVSVAPVYDADGQVIGGVETFTDFSEAYEDLERARLIQTLSMEHDLPKDGRVRFSTCYVPHDIIGGDYFAIQQLDADHYCFFLADVTGHGVAAALYTIHLSSLWNRYCHTLKEPIAFAQQLNRDLCRIVKDQSFATAICGIIDAAQKTVRVVSAGGPPPVLVRSNGRTEQVDIRGFPFGFNETATYEQSEFLCESGDCLLMFTDGAVEIHDAAGNMLETEGLIGILTSLDYPKTSIKVEPLHKALLNFSNVIRLDDDLTLLEVRFS